MAIGSIGSNATVQRSSTAQSQKSSSVTSNVAKPPLATAKGVTANTVESANDSAAVERMKLTTSDEGPKNAFAGVGTKLNVVG
jgi:hypothetical protein